MNVSPEGLLDPDLTEISHPKKQQKSFTNVRPKKKITLFSVGGVPINSFKGDSIMVSYEENAFWTRGLLIAIPQVPTGKMAARLRGGAINKMVYVFMV